LTAPLPSPSLLDMRLAREARFCSFGFFAYAFTR
jgi:hypothetical protein